MVSGEGLFMYTRVCSAVPWYVLERTERVRARHGVTLGVLGASRLKSGQEAFENRARFTVFEIVVTGRPVVLRVIYTPVPSGTEAQL